MFKTLFLLFLLLSWTSHAQPSRLYFHNEHQWPLKHYNWKNIFLLNLNVPQDVDSLLRTCPTNDETTQIRKDFNIYFDRELENEGPWTCIEGENKPSTMLAVYNVFRLMKLIQFDEPLPLIGYNNVYEWLKSLQINIHFFFGEGYSNASREEININASGLDDPIYLSWIDLSAGAGLGDLIALIMHEARHTRASGDYSHHPCGEGYKDFSLEYGGAWALEYYYYLWLAEHSSHYLNSHYYKSEAAFFAQSILNTRFCNR